MLFHLLFMGIALCLPTAPLLSMDPFFNLEQQLQHHGMQRVLAQAKIHQEDPAFFSNKRVQTALALMQPPFNHPLQYLNAQSPNTFITTIGTSPSLADIAQATIDHQHQAMLLAASTTPPLSAADQLRLHQIHELQQPINHILCTLGSSYDWRAHQLLAATFKEGKFGQAKHKRSSYQHAHSAMLLYNNALSFHYHAAAQQEQPNWQENAEEMLPAPAAEAEEEQEMEQVDLQEDLPELMHPEAAPATAPAAPLHKKKKKKAARKLRPQITTAAPTEPQQHASLSDFPPLPSTTYPDLTTPEAYKAYTTAPQEPSQPGSVGHLETLLQPQKVQYGQTSTNDDLSALYKRPGGNQNSSAPSSLLQAPSPAAPVDEGKLRKQQEREREKERRKQRELEAVRREQERHQQRTQAAKERQEALAQEQQNQEVLAGAAQEEQTPTDYTKDLTATSGALPAQEALPTEQQQTAPQPPQQKKKKNTEQQAEHDHQEFQESVTPLSYAKIAELKGEYRKAISLYEEFLARPTPKLNAKRTQEFQVIVKDTKGSLAYCKAQEAPSADQKAFLLINAAEYGHIYAVRELIQKIMQEVMKGDHLTAKSTAHLAYDPHKKIFTYLETFMSHIQKDHTRHKELLDVAKTMACAHMMLSTVHPRTLAAPHRVPIAQWQGWLHCFRVNRAHMVYLKAATEQPPFTSITELHAQQELSTAKDEALAHLNAAWEVSATKPELQTSLVDMAFMLDQVNALDMTKLSRLFNNHIKKRRADEDVRLWCGRMVFAFMPISIYVGWQGGSHVAQAINRLVFNAPSSNGASSSMIPPALPAQTLFAPTPAACPTAPSFFPSTRVTNTPPICPPVTHHLADVQELPQHLITRAGELAKEAEILRHSGALPTPNAFRFKKHPLKPTPTLTPQDILAERNLRSDVERGNAKALLQLGSLLAQRLEDEHRYANVKSINELSAADQELLTLLNRIKNHSSSTIIGALLHTRTLMMLTQEPWHLPNPPQEYKAFWKAWLAICIAKKAHLTYQKEYRLFRQAGDTVTMQNLKYMRAAYTENAMAALHEARSEVLPDRLRMLLTSMSQDILAFIDLPDKK